MIQDFTQSIIFQVQYLLNISHSIDKGDAKVFSWPEGHSNKLLTCLQVRMIYSMLDVDDKFLLADVVALCISTTIK